MKQYLFLFLLAISIASASAIDVNPPLIKSINVVDIGVDHAKIVWFTDEPSTSFIEMDSFIANSTQLVTNHSIPLRGLAPEREYLYNITSCDSLGNCATAAGDALRFTTAPLYTGSDKNLNESDARRLVRASSSEAYLVNFAVTNPFKGSFLLRSGFLFTINGSEQGFVISKMADPGIELTFVPKTNITSVKLNQTRSFDLNNDTIPDIEVHVSGIGRKVLLGGQGLRYLAYYANMSIKSLETIEKKVEEKPRVNFTEEIVPYKFPSGPDKEGKINVLSKLLPNEGPSVFIGLVIFLAVLLAGLFILWLARSDR